MLDKIKEYISKCPFLKDGAIGVDYLDNNVSYSIEQIPVDPMLRQYADGSSLRQLVFVFASKEAYGPDVINNLLNCKFYDDFYDWIYTNNLNRILPSIDGIQSIKCTSTGYAYQIDETSARYQIQMMISYFRK